MNYSDCVVNDETGAVYQWWYDECFIEPWQKYMLDPPLRFRAHVYKSSKAASRKRLTLLIKENAKWLKGSRRTDIDYLCHKFAEAWHGALRHIRDTCKDETALEALCGQYQTTMGPWQFCRDLKNVCYLNELYLGKNPEESIKADELRRKEKAKIINAFREEMNSFINAMVIRTESNDQLEAMLDYAKCGMWNAEDALQQSKYENDEFDTAAEIRKLFPDAFEKQA